MTSSTSESRNGIRHPHALNASSAMLARQTPITTSEMKNPSVAVVWIQLVCSPRLLSGACSAT